MSHNKTKTVTQVLQEHSVRCGVYYAGLSARQRDEAQNDFVNDRVEMVHAAIAFGMDIDKSDIRWMIHYNLPKNIESPYQEIGRTGRDGMPSDTILLYSLGDLILLTKFATESNQQNTNLEKLNWIQQYAEADICRRRILLSYFGETVTGDCDNYDVRRNPPRRFDGTVIVQGALNAIIHTNQQADITLLIDILRGSPTAEITEKAYMELKTFEAGGEISTRDWQDCLLQILQMGYFEIAYNKNNHPKIAKSGSDVLFGRERAMLVVIRRGEPTTARKRRKTVDVHAQAQDGESRNKEEDLLEASRALRRQLTDQEALPIYIVLSDKAPHLLYLPRPTAVEAFGNINGIGEYKKKRYGKEFVALIRQFV